MKKSFLLFFGMFCLFVSDAGAARPSMSEKMMAAPRAGVASKNQISAAATLTADEAVVSKASLKAGDVNANLEINPDEMLSVKKNMREKERLACISNNIGISNTFVWASRYSDSSSYVSMVEDVEEPENNTCFVKTALKSNDPKINVSNVPTRYFEMGQVVTCGEWADYEALKQQILDAKKKGRTLGTIAAVVGGAGVGVGAMELFGNKVIGGKVEGQYNENLSDAQLLRSQLLTLQKEDAAKYNEFTTKLGQLRKKCTDFGIAYNNQPEPADCTKYKDVFPLLDSMK